MANVIVRPALDLPWAHGKKGLRPIKGLDLRFLVDAQHQGSIGWVQIQADNVTDLLNEQGIGGELIQSAINRLKSRGFSGCVLVGDPAYYYRFGFEPSNELHYSQDVGDAFQVRAFENSFATGTVDFHPVFGE